MSSITRVSKVLVILFLVVSLGACAPGPYYYQSPETGGPAPGPVQETTYVPIDISPNDETFTFRVEDQSPFGPYNFSRSLDLLYQKGYNEVRRQRDADLAIDVAISASAQENPGVRAGNTLGGALAGAAAGAIIGGALGDPGAGAAIGAASGGVLGFASPAATPFVTIDVNIYSNTERRSFNRSASVDLTNVPPPNVRNVIAGEVYRLLQDIPAR